MSYQELDGLLKQLEVLKKLSANSADARWALDSIRECAREIERAIADLAADYARDIRVAVENLADAHTARGERLSETVVGERIHRLEDYVDLVLHAPPEDLACLRPWG